MFPTTQFLQFAASTIYRYNKTLNYTKKIKAFPTKNCT